MNWSSDPPRISGWWFVGRKLRGRGQRAINVNIVHVEKLKLQWRWCHINQREWYSCDEPKYKWAGPITSPSLENFNRAK